MASHFRNGKEPSLGQFRRILALLLVSALTCLHTGSGALPGAAALQRTRGVRVKELTDENFEHDTQAASGQTTGRWLVIFVGDELDQSELDKEAQEPHEPEEEAEPAKEPLSSADIIHSVMLMVSQMAHREFVPALVHVAKNPLLKKRFGVTSTPHVKLFRDRKMYTFKGTPRSPSELRHFLELGFSAHPAEDVPPEPSYWETLLEDLPHKYKQFRKEAAEKPWLLAIVCPAIVIGVYALARMSLSKKKPKAPKPSARRAAKRD